MASHQKLLTEYFALPPLAEKSLNCNEQCSGTNQIKKLFSNSVQSTELNDLKNSEEKVQLKTDFCKPSKKRKRQSKEDFFAKQTIIDAGQKLTERCIECGMLYGVQESNEHVKFHNRKQSKDFISVSGRTALQWKRHFLPVQIFNDGQIYKIVEEEAPKAIRTLLKRLIETEVNDEIGFSAVDFPIWTRNRKMFVFATNSKMHLAALVLVDAITNAQYYQSGQPVTDSNGKRPLLGVNRLWVHKAYRRGGLATRLIDCARLNFFVGIALSRDRVAFSEPTLDGLNFAAKFLNGLENVLVYALE